MHDQKLKKLQSLEETTIYKQNDIEDLWRHSVTIGELVYDQQAIFFIISGEKTCLVVELQNAKLDFFLS